ncbi:3-hydroxybutyryl-CoA dehydrogenase [Kitasatospora sp. MAP12-15]|uniref:3-hydroxyacyl-CoA dehydrogenase family protein n=1 Tax=unclassified Kitasatospora TaxID=2633591 RepID=UPI0024750ECB|nr:3-hydroxyacyl-CoA dehydrogenase family protein [Kitasatospora sp. MAP12-44]MDH6113682.1 3-hydroxybutyryl-CoA dehydrogenase [Kitasatospora sp. MAP12-44]
MEHNRSVIGVVGLGTVGEALLGLAATAGHRVIGVDCDPGVLERVARRTAAAQAGAEATAGTVLTAERTVTLTSDLAELAAADVVFEAVPDRRETKIEVLRRINESCGPATPTVTTTSTLAVPYLAIAAGSPAHTVGLRLFLPPGGVGKVELTGTAATDPGCLAEVRALVAGLGLTEASVGARPGDAAMALVYGYLNRAVDLYEQGYADAVDIDAAMRLGCGLPYGPLELLDLIGLDTAHEVLTDLHHSVGAAAFAPAPLLTRMVEAGLLGRKSEAGFHRYDALGARVEQAADGADAAAPCDLRRIGVLGSGTMARGIAEVVAAAGFSTVLVARSQQKADAALGAIGDSLLRGVRRGRISPDGKAQTLERLAGTADLAALGDCDLVIEAVAEDLAVKRELFGRLDAVCRPGAVLATTTSSLSVADCAEATVRRRDVLGLHFFNPAPVMRLVEVVRTESTDQAALAVAHAFCARLGKTGVDCPDRAGFIVNYLLFPYLGSAVRMLDQHDVGVAELDAAVELGFGYPMGPFALLDAIGLDVSLAIQHRLHEEFPTPEFAPAVLLEQLVKLGHLGRKTGLGFKAVPPRNEVLAG